MPLDTPLVCTVGVAPGSWADFVKAVEAPGEEGFRAYVRFLTEPRFLGAGESALRAEFRDAALILVADAQTFAHPDLPVLCIDPEGQSPSFRAGVKLLWSVENNISIGNLLFEEIAEDQVVDGWLVAE